MWQVHGVRRFLLSTVLVALSAVGCTVSDVKAPSLQGPSERALAMTLTAVPDVLSYDGASQAQITVQARGEDGKSKANVSFRAEIWVGSTIVDCGSLSARTLVTGNDGRALLTYTAPSSACDSSGLTDKVDIRVTPSGTDAATAEPWRVSIRLVAPGGALPGAPTPKFTINDSEVTTTLQPYTDARFDASTSTPAAGSAIASYQWSFGDGGTATGAQVFHKFNPGTYFVTLTVTSTVGASQSLSRQITVSQGVAPTANFVFSPTAPVVGQTVLFNGSTSTAAAGRTLTRHDWNFGNGSEATGITVSTTYAAAGSYTVVLTITDDVGQTGLRSQSIAIGAAPAVTASFTVSPTNPGVGTAVFFNASASSSPNGPIVSYEWDFGDSGTVTTTTSPLISKPAGYAAARTYVVRLTVTDSTGAKATTTVTVTVA